MEKADSTTDNSSVWLRNVKMVDLRVGKKGLRWAGHWENLRDVTTADRQVSNWVLLWNHAMDSQPSKEIKK